MMDVITNTLVLTVGWPRAGKSFWCSQMIKEKGYVIVNPDSIRLAFHGKAFDSAYENRVWKTVEIMIKSLFLAGHSTVVLDATSVTRKSRKKWEKIGEKERFTVKYIVFNTPVPICEQRAQEGNREDLISVIQRMFRQYQPLNEEEQKNCYPKDDLLKPAFNQDEENYELSGLV